MGSCEETAKVLLEAQAWFFCDMGWIGINGQRKTVDLCLNLFQRNGLFWLNLVPQF